MTDTVIGAARIVAGFDTAYLEETLNKATLKAKQGGSRLKGAFAKGFHGFSDEIRGELDSIAGQVPIVGGQVTALGGVFGAVAVGGLAAFVAGLNQARLAMDWAADLTDQATIIGVTAEALQEYHYMADEAGVSIEDMDASLKTLNGTLGAMKTGIGDAKLKKVFDALGITKADLMPLRDASELLPLLADKISKLGSQAEQAQVANKLGIGPLLPLLQQGADKMDLMRQKAHEMGLVISNETVSALDDAQRKAEVASQVIDTQLKVAFANLAPVITSTTQLMADGTKGLATFIDGIGKLQAAQRGLVRWTFTGGEIREKGLALGLSGKELNDYIARQNELVYKGRKGVRGGTGMPIKEGWASAPASSVPPPLAASELDKKSGRSKAAPTGPNDPRDGMFRNDLTLDGKTEGFRTLAQLALDVSVATADVNDQLELTPGFLDPIIQKQDQVKGIVSGVATDLIYGFAEAADRGEDMGDVVLGVLKKWMIQWGIMKAAGFLGLDLQNGGLKSGGRLDKVVTSILDKIPGFAAGTLYAPGGVAMVGERGKELVNLPRGAQVFPADVTRAIMQGRDSQTTVRVFVDQDGNWQAAVQSIAAGVATPIARDTSRQQIGENNRNLPGMQQRGQQRFG